MLKKSAASLVIGKILVVAVLVAPYYAGCASHSVRTYKESKTATITFGNAVPSQEKIDKYATYEILFLLEQSSDSISVAISSEYTADILGTKKNKKTFFVLEKAIDVRQFKDMKAEYFYAEMGKSYTADWKPEKELTVVSEKGNPFRDLGAGTRYRIRFTTFSPENFDFTIKIEADSKVIFIDSTE